MKSGLEKSFWNSEIPPWDYFLLLHKRAQNHKFRVNNYLLTFFDHLPPFIDIFYLIIDAMYLMNVNEKSTFFDHLPPSFWKHSLWMAPNRKTEKAKATLQGRPALVRSDFVVWLEVELNFYFLLYFGFLHRNSTYKPWFDKVHFF